jgi:predicted DNA-binding protein (MmcQ/YjbR family)
MPLRRAQVLDQCRRLPGAREEYPFGDDTAVFKVGGKIFALVSLADEPGSVSLKCDPGYAALLREQYPAVTPGYHLAKRHWNTVRLDGSVPADELRAWVEESYELVVAGLPRARRDALPRRA